MRAARQSAVLTERSVVDVSMIPLDPAITDRINTNRLKALERKQHRSGGLRLPEVSQGCCVPATPSVPTDFLHGAIPYVDANLLKLLHGHSRDDSITFTASTHTYYILGNPTLGSVTGLVHKFASNFEADSVIKLIMGGRTWPRPGYLQVPPPLDILHEFSSRKEACTLLSLLMQNPCDEERVCSESTRLCRALPDVQRPVRALGMTVDQIKQNGITTEMKQPIVVHSCT